MSEPQELPMLSAPFEFPIEAGHVGQFAYAVGDPNPIYRDSGYAETTEVGQVIAPPTFTMAAAHFDPDWPLRPQPGQPWRGSGRTPSGTAEADQSASAAAQPIGLHAEQHFEYHRHIRPGDVLTVTERPGPSWEKDGKRGRMHFAEVVTEFTDQDGEPVVTARRIGVRIIPSDGA